MKSIISAFFVVLTRLLSFSHCVNRKRDKQKMRYLKTIRFILINWPTTQGNIAPLGFTQFGASQGIVPYLLCPVALIYYFKYFSIFIFKTYKAHFVSVIPNYYLIILYFDFTSLFFVYKNILKSTV